MYRNHCNYIIINLACKFLTKSCWTMLNLLGKMLCHLHLLTWHIIIDRYLCSNVKLFYIWHNTDNHVQFNLPISKSFSSFLLVFVIVVKPSTSRFFFCLYIFPLKSIPSSAAGQLPGSFLFKSAIKKSTAGHLLRRKYQ